jgi:hypothetical protein
MTRPERIDLTLLDEVRATVQGAPAPTPLDLAVHAAAEDDPSRRSVLLVELAARLRAYGHDDLALRAADAAIAASGSADAVRAARIQAVAIHADRGRLAEAQALGESLLEQGRERPLQRALAHVYWERFLESGDEHYRERWRETSADLAQSQAA